jgi:major membrane immunogen (membrane-anchored lipoprotein)
MKATKYLFLVFVVFVLATLIFLVGCSSSDLSESGGQDTGDGDSKAAEDEDTGISDVFEDSEEVNPPQIPN